MTGRASNRLLLLGHEKWGGVLVRVGLRFKHGVQLSLNTDMDERLAGPLREKGIVKFLLKHLEK